MNNMTQSSLPRFTLLVSGKTRPHTHTTQRVPISQEERQSTGGGQGGGAVDCLPLVEGHGCYLHISNFSNSKVTVLLQGTGGPR